MTKNRIVVPENWQKSVTTSWFIVFLAEIIAEDKEGCWAEDGYLREINEQFKFRTPGALRVINEI